jgi:hypothetical protein
MGCSRRYPSERASHTIPTATSPMGTRRVNAADSPKTIIMPATAAPTAPVPVHAAYPVPTGRSRSAQASNTMLMTKPHEERERGSELDQP